MEINFTPTAKQYQLFQTFDDATTLQCLYGGSVGSAKSYGLCSLVAIKCLQYAGIRVLLSRNELKNLKQTTLVSFFEVMNDWGLKQGVDFNYNQIASEIRFNNGSTIILKELRYLPSDPDFERIRGLLLTFAVIDEASEVTRKAQEIVSSRCTRWLNQEYGIKGMVFYTCNPSKSWIYDDFYLPWIADTLPEHRVFIQALPTDNPYLSPEYLNNLKLTLSDAEYQTLVLGKWEFSADPNQLVSFAEAHQLYDHQLTEQDAISTGVKTYITADIAFESDKCIIVVWAGLDVLRVINHDKDKKPEDVILELAKEYRVLASNIIYDATGAGLYLKNYLRGGYAFHSGGSPIKAKGEFEHLKTQVYFKLAEAIASGAVRVLDTTLKDELIAEVTQIKTLPKEKLDGKIKMIKKDEIKRNIGRSPDILDTLAMRMVRELKGTSDAFLF